MTRANDKSRTGAPCRRELFYMNRACKALLQWFIFVVLAGLYPALHVNADEIRPALLDIKEQSCISVCLICFHNFTRVRPYRQFAASSSAIIKVIGSNGDSIKPLRV